MKTRIEELTSFGRQLDAAQADLETHSSDGGCGVGCGCVPTGSAGTRVPQPVELTRARPGPDAGTGLIDGAVLGKALAQTPVACSLSTAAQPARLGKWKELLALAVDRAPLPGRMRLRFPPDPAVAARMGDLAVREQACCSFFIFTLHLAPDAVTLDVQAPEDALAVLSEMFEIPA